MFSGVRAFESLDDLTSKMAPHAMACGYTLDKIDHIKSGIKSAFKYYQSNYVFNLDNDSPIRTHNMDFLTSDSKNINLQNGSFENLSFYCKSCPNCDLAPKLSMILNAMCLKIEEKKLADEHTIGGWKHIINTTEVSIKEWRNFLVRNKKSNLDWASYLSVEQLDHAVLTIDFAMNHLPEKPR